MHFTRNQNIGSVYLAFKSIPSTHVHAINLVLNDSPSHGTVISADFQTDGIGQHEKSWFSDSGKNILLSIILFPENMSPSKLFLMNIASCLAVRETVIEFYPLPQNVFVKWPNDIYINNKKIAGILTKNSLNFHKVQSCILSIGLNVNQDSFPNHLPLATSLFLNTSKNLNRKEVESHLFSKLEEHFVLLNENPSLLEAKYHECLYGLNENLPFLNKKTNETFHGFIIGISKAGELIIQDPSKKETFHFQHGELIYL